MTIGFLGTGNMGGALATAAAKSKETIWLFDKDGQKCSALAEKIGALAVPSAAALCEGCDFLFLGVKPNLVAPVLAELRPALEKRPSLCLVSMAAGVDIASLVSALGGLKIPVIRIMPNTPVACGKGAISYCVNDEVTAKEEGVFHSVLRAAGTLHRLDEKLLDAASAVAGCGPAYAYLFLEAMADGGVECGLPRALALSLAAETLAGAAAMVLESGRHPGELKDAVCSPGGSTIVGVHALEDGGFRSLVMDSVCASYEKTKELGGARPPRPPFPKPL